jgi:hypothetical protein
MMHEYEHQFKGNYGLLIWLRDLAPTFGIQVGGKTIRELMDEIQCASLSLKAHSAEKTLKNGAVIDTISPAASETVSTEVKVRTPPTVSYLGRSMTQFPLREIKE